VKFGTKNLNVMPLSNCEFCTYQCNESQTSPKCTQGVLPYFPHCSTSWVGGGLVQMQSSVSYLRGLKGFLHDFHPWCPIWVKYDAYKTIWQFKSFMHNSTSMVILFFCK